MCNTKSENLKKHIQTVLSYPPRVLGAFAKLHRTIILPVVLYGCEAWSLTAREETKLRVFENMVLRRILDLGGMR